MATAMKKKLYTKYRRTVRARYWLFHRNFNMAVGQYHEDYFKLRFIRTEDQFENEDQLPPFTNAILAEAIYEINNTIPEIYVNAIAA